MGVERVYPDIVYELANSITLIKRNVDADKLAIKLIILRFSAGALWLLPSVNWHRDWLVNALRVPRDLLKPNVLILAYPVVDFVAMYRYVEATQTPRLRGCFTRWLH